MINLSKPVFFFFFLLLLLPNSIMRSLIPLILRRLRTMPPRHNKAWWCCGESLSRMMTAVSDSFFNQNVELLMNPPLRTKKPFLKPAANGKQKKKQKKEKNEGQENQVLHPPENGLLVPHLIPVAQDTMKAWKSLVDGATKILTKFPVKVCRYCPAAHVGPVGHQIASCEGPHNGIRRGRHDWINGNIDHVLPRNNVFHLTDRLGRTINHDERHKIKKVPAIVELCIQAGVDVSGYPTKRRTNPVIMIDKKIIDFDDWENESNISSEKRSRVEFELRSSSSRYGLEISPRNDEALPALAVQTMQAWLAVRKGAEKLMSKYYVQVCGYCPQLHVGPKGTKTCDCFAYKHQMRSGHHHWQEASIDDLMPPVYVWHLRDRCGPPLLTELRVFYGAAPAIVELCIQAGAPIPEQYKPMMRLDVVIPEPDEIEKVV